MKGFLDKVTLSSVSDFESKLFAYTEANSLFYPHYLNLENDIDEPIINTIISTLNQRK